MIAPENDNSQFGSPGDTIAAVASPPGNGAISIIRVSGPAALEYALAIFSPAAYSSKPPEHAKMILGNILDPVSSRTIDQSMAVFYRAPNTYTGENLVEIFCHGGRLVTKEVLNALLASGARPALPGEFTQRALLHGKMDLTQAEAVLDVVSARNQRFLDAALKKLAGTFGNQLKHIRASLINLLASIEVAIDYPEDDTPQVSPETIRDVFLETLDKLRRLISASDSSKINNDGIRIAVVGRPNVGKSSLMNAMLNDTRVIVSDTPGTTRDLVGEWTAYDNLDFHIMDTAGITSSSDSIEMEGVKKTLNYISVADIILAVFDASSPWMPEDDSVVDNIRSADCVIPVLNKTDLDVVLDDKRLSELFKKPIHSVSAKTGAGISSLMDLLSCLIKDSEGVDSEAYYLGARQKNLLLKAISAIENGLSAVGRMPDDIIAADLREAADSIGKITGESITEDLLNTIFENFCVGK